VSRRGCGVLRLALVSDARGFNRWRFSTPVWEYRAFGAHRLAARGEARWHPPAGEYAYGEFEMLDVTYNVLEP
jgi:hypothetical protein